MRKEETSLTGITGVSRVDTVSICEVKQDLKTSDVIFSHSIQIVYRLYFTILTFVQICIV